MDDATPERFVDAMPLLLMTTASLRAGAALHPAGEWDVRRFRPNVLLDASGVGLPPNRGGLLIVA